MTATNEKPPTPGPTPAPTPTIDAARTHILRAQIRDVPDFPKPGIVFKDITPLVGDARAFGTAVDLFAERYLSRGLRRVVAIESRGFIFGAALATRLEVPMALVRKPGKLPYERHSIRYALEYGEGVLEMHTDAVQPGEHVIIVDDVLATGGTAAAAAALCQKLGGVVDEFAFVIELGFLAGRKKLGDIPIFALLEYP